MKRIKISTFILFLFLLSKHVGFSQTNDKSNFQIGLNSSYFISGDLSAVYDFTLGTEVQYFIKHNSRFHHYLNGSFTRDIGSSGANLHAFDLGIGSQFDILKLWNKPLFVQITASGLYIQENFSTQLIENTIKSSVSEYGFKLKAGIGYQFSNRWHFQLNASQFSTMGTTAGVGVFFLF